MASSDRARALCAYLYAQQCLFDEHTGIELGPFRIDSIEEGSAGRGSFECVDRESLERLGLDTLPLVYLHDPEKISFEEGVAPGGPLEALIALRDEGVIDHLGVAGGPIDLELQYLATEAFDAVISHNRFTLVDQSAEPLLDDAQQRGVAFVNAAPFGGGMLVKGPDAVPTYCYAPVADEVLERVRRMESLCAGFGVPLAAAAVQFSLRDPRVTSTIVGMSAPERVAQTVELAEFDIPEALWDALLPVARLGRAGVLA